MKTISLKKVSAVAVASLGFGLLSVVPAHAGNGGITAVTVADGSATAFVGADVSIPVKVTTTGTPTTNGDDGFTFTPTNPTNVSGATAPAITAAIANGGTAATSTQYLLEAVAATGYTGGQTGNTQTLVTTTNAANLSATTIANLQFKPQTAGKYVFVVTPTKSAGKTWAAEPTLTAGTFTVTVLSLGGKIGDGGAVLTPFDKVNGVAGTYNYVTLQANGMARTSGALGTQVVVTGGTLISASGQTLSEDKTKFTIAGVNNATTAGTASTILVATPVVGTVTVKTYTETAAGVYSTTAADTVTITVTTAAQTGTLSVANSTAVVDSSSVDGAAHNNATTVDETILVSKNASTVANNNTEEVGLIKVVLKDSLTNLMPDGTLVTATLSGSGNLGIAHTSAPSSGTGRAVSVATASANGTVVIALYRDGTEGTGTITISVGTTVVATKTASFYGTASKYVAVVKKQHIANSGSSTADVIEVTATDKAGNLVPSSVIGASVGTSTIATVTSSATTASTGKALFAMTGLATKFGAVVVTFADSATAPTVTTTATVGVSSVLAKTVTAATDKTTYTAGAPITWTLTFKDANGLGIPDGTYTAGNLLASSAANPVASASLPSIPFKGDVNIDVVAGVATAKGFAPLTAGPVSYTWTLGGTAGAADTTNLVTALQATTVTASATVTDASAAIQTSIAALNAKIVALNALIAKIMKRLNIR